MGIGKSKITPSINIDDMLKKAESNHELEAEKQDADKRFTEIRAYSGGYPFSISGDIRSVPS